MFEYISPTKNYIFLSYQQKCMDLDTSSHNNGKSQLPLSIQTKIDNITHYLIYYLSPPYLIIFLIINLVLSSCAGY
jgi:hypothetical protein